MLLTTQVEVTFGLKVSPRSEAQLAFRVREVGGHTAVEFERMTQDWTEDVEIKT